MALPNRLYISFLRLPLLLRILFIALLVFLFFGISIHFLEPKTFPSIFDGIWWAIITGTTVGYGDYVPSSFWGRLTALLLILLGAGIVSSYFGTLAAAAVTKQDALSEGKIEFIAKITSPKYSQMVVLIDETLPANPINSRLVHFIQGKSHVDETILKSNVEKAEKVLITADRGNDELQADMNSILALLTIKGLCPQIKCIVEILTAEQVVNALRAGADEVIQSNKLTSVFMVNSLHSNGDGLLSDFVHHLQESRLSAHSVNERDIGKTFIEACQEFLTKKIMLIGIKRGEETMLNPSHSLKIEENDLFLLFK
jgi:voltage-gated potassium channel